MIKCPIKLQGTISGHVAVGKIIMNLSVLSAE